jgi:hypothetical protein
MILVRNPEAKRRLGRPRRRWVDNIKMDLVEMGWMHVHRIGLDQDRYRWRVLVIAETKFRTEGCRLLGCYAVWFFLRSVNRLPVTANIVPSSPILIILMMEAISFFETSFPTRATRHNIPEDGILDSAVITSNLKYH